MTNRGPTAEEIARDAAEIVKALRDDAEMDARQRLPEDATHDQVMEVARESTAWVASDFIDRLPAALKEAIAGANERAAKEADKIADETPPTNERHPDYLAGWQDGAMEAAAAIRELNLPPEHQDEGK